MDWTVARGYLRHGQVPSVWLSLESPLLILLQLWYVGLGPHRVVPFRNPGGGVHAYPKKGSTMKHYPGSKER